MVTKMRFKGTGTFCDVKKSWRVRLAGQAEIQISVRKLNKRYGTAVAQTQQASRSLWTRYLQEIADTSTASQLAASPIPRRIQSIQAMIERYRSENRSENEIKPLLAMLAESLAVPHWSTDYPDVPIVHPDRQLMVDMLGLNDDELAIGFINQTVSPLVKPKIENSLISEVNQFLDRKRAKNKKSEANTHKLAFDLFTGITGDIDIRDITVSHYRDFCEAVQKRSTWGERTQYNHQQHLKSFLKKIESDYNLPRFGFLLNKEYQLICPDGQKIKWTIDEVKTALSIATGDVRLALLLGLNAGMYWSDIWDTTKDHFDGTYLNRDRVKNRKPKKKSRNGSYFLWNETKSLLQFDETTKKLIIKKSTEQNFRKKFRNEHKLPTHIALRKTVSQIIEDHKDHGVDVARLYRNESVGGGHGKLYSDQSVEQTVRVSSALKMVAEAFGIE